MKINTEYSLLSSVTIALGCESKTQNDITHFGDLIVTIFLKPISFFPTNQETSGIQEKVLCNLRPKDCE